MINGTCSNIYTRISIIRYKITPIIPLSVFILNWLLDSCCWLLLLWLELQLYTLGIKMPRDKHAKLANNIEVNFLIFINILSLNNYVNFSLLKFKFSYYKNILFFCCQVNLSLRLCPLSWYKRELKAKKNHFFSLDIKSFFQNIY